MSRISWLVGSMSLAALMLLADASQAQPQLPVSLEILHHQLEMQKSIVAAWERDARIEFSLLILVVVLGGVVALLQKQEGKKWVAYVVAISGILISTITYGTKEFFDADHKTLRKAALAGKVQISLAGEYLEHASTPDMSVEDRAALLSLVAAAIAKLTEIADRVQNTVASSNEPIGILQPAYAQPVARPAWTRERQSQTATVYRFVGEAVDGSLATAQSQAVANAKAAAAAALRVPRETVDRYARQVETYMEFDRNKRTYRFFALIEINRSFVQR